MKLLAVDTALGACSVAILDGDEVRAHIFEPMERGHAERLAPMVDDAMRRAELAYAQLDRLVVTTGPGTFTGQRVGLAFMRGLRVALDRPLLGVTTLAAMAAQAISETELAKAAALHDARRGEVYLQSNAMDEPVLLPFADALDTLTNMKDRLALAGTAAPAAAPHLGSAILSTVRQPDALWVARLARTMPPPAVAPRPLYLRAPDAKLPRPA
ncbi:MAG TPA: tRNA (adenosine(37)-N6)-threonylcarbamoyltransferase complex dimerization subunit type 1 TsaB [Rhizomicrobium sp.]|nr:tRNA (adenosine(37)-N6)-threonylcarbamoyltransferase complex dimerization subunit type 1 TsaB [Rhizomicrobium sp.]